jgi:hypothetical protein
MQVLNNPVALPGRCIVCGSPGGDGRKFIDFGLSMEFYGSVYFCTFCFTEGMNIQGWLSPEQSQLLFDKLKTYEDRLSVLEAQNVKLRNALSQLDFLGVAGLGDFSSSGESPSEQEDSRVPDETDIGSVESPTVKRSSDVPSDESDLELSGSELTNLDDF